MLSLAFADPSFSSLGRASLANMDDQTLMELLVGERKMSRSKKRTFVDTDGHFRDIHEWRNVKFDANGAVARVDWRESGMRGSLETQYMPQTTQSFIIRGNFLKGTIGWRTLPAALEIFHISFNQFSGSVDLSGLPPHFEFLNIAQNKFSGSVDLSGIVRSIKKLTITQNQLHGMLDLSFLPEDTVFNFDEDAFEVKGQRKSELHDRCN